MPPPTNITCLTAIDLGTTPSVVMQDVNDGGVTYTVWYKYTAQPGDTVIGVFAFGDLIAYTALLEVLSPDCMTDYLGGFYSENLAIQFPVIVGDTYYFNISSSSGNVGTANLNLSWRRAPTTTGAAGDIMIPDDSFGYGAVLSPVDGSVKRFSLDVPGTEVADNLDDGTVLAEYDNSTWKLLNAQLELITDIALTTVSGPSVTANRVTNRFWIADRNTGNSQIYMVSATGVVSAVIATLSGASVQRHAFGISIDESIAYYMANGSTNQPIKLWNLLSDTSAGDFAAGVVGYAVKSLTVLRDDTVLAAYENGTDFFIRHYDAAGAILETYTYAIAQDSNGVLMAAGVDDPDSFWAWVHLGNGISQFIHITTNGGAELANFEAIQYEGGIYKDFNDPTANPDAFFGHSSSCPILIMRGGEIDIDGTLGPIAWMEWTRLIP